MLPYSSSVSLRNLWDTRDCTCHFYNFLFSRSFGNDLVVRCDSSLISISRRLDVGPSFLCCTGAQPHCLQTACQEDISLCFGGSSPVSLQSFTNIDTNLCTRKRLNQENSSLSKEILLLVENKSAISSTMRE